MQGRVAMQLWAMHGPPLQSSAVLHSTHREPAVSQTIFPDAQSRSLVHAFEGTHPESRQRVLAEQSPVVRQATQRPAAREQTEPVHSAWEAHEAPTLLASPPAPPSISTPGALASDSSTGPPAPRTTVFVEQP